MSGRKSGRVYVDNASNRSLGRVGMPLGSAVHNRATGTITNKLATSGYASTLQHGKVHSSSLTFGDFGTHSSSQGRASSAGSERVYADNASNRRLGRVGMPLGSAVHNKATGTITNKLATSDYAPTSQPGKVYTDNSLNRSLGRVGMPMGSAVHDKRTGTLTIKLGPGSNDFTHPNTQFGQSFKQDNYNKTTKSACYRNDAPTSQPGKVYKDNPLNRSLGRVGMPMGSAVHDKTTGKLINKLDTGSDKLVHSTTKPEKHAGLDKRPPENKSQANPLVSEKVYRDNPQNRRLGRVGMPLGTAVYDKKLGIIKQVNYKDNPLNRKLQRVGLPRGSAPHTKKSRTTSLMRQFLYDTKDEDETSFDWDYRDEIQSVRLQDGDYNTVIQTQLSSSDRFITDYAKEQVLCYRNRKLEEIKWQVDQQEDLKTRSDVLLYNGTEISYEDIAIGKQIGNGGFGEVFFANWKGAVVAVKKLRAGTMSNKRIKQFEEEMQKCCRFEHDNIVKFIGACLERPNLCIVMEYMEMCLFHAIHVDSIDFTDSQRISIIQQVTEGLKYLHGMKTAHCDLKPHNILMSIQDDETVIAKISDFGLSMIKAYSQSSAYVDAVRHVGTPRYSAPEVLRGEFLETLAMMTADIYSLSLVYLEIIYEEELFCEYTYPQLQQQVGKNGVKPQVPEDFPLEKNILAMILRGCSFKPEERPDIDELDTFWHDVTCLYTSEKDESTKQHGQTSLNCVSQCTNPVELN